MTGASARTTVVVPTYNSSAFLVATLQSVFTQTELPAEIVVVDDCSTDDTLAIARRLAADAPVPLRVESMPTNTGNPAGPMNAGVELARTEYVALLEHDDLMLSDRLRLQRQALDTHAECCMAIGTIVQFTADALGVIRWGAPIPPHPDLQPLYADHAGQTFEVPARMAFRALVSGNFVHTNSNILLRKSHWDRLGGYRPAWPRNNDAELEFRWFAHHPIAIVDQPCCGYRRTAGSLYHANLLRSLVDGQRLRLQVLRKKPEWSAGLRGPVRDTLRRYSADAWRKGARKSALLGWRDLLVDQARGD